MDSKRGGAPAPLQGSYRLGTSFQAVFSVAEGRLCGHEALARPVDGLGLAVRPADFFASRPEAELVRLDRECRRAHLARFAALEAGEGLLFLNVHPAAALADRFAPLEVLDMILAHRLAPSRVCVEILESECRDEAALAEAARAYRGLGMGLALDDFGVVHSNIDRVAALRPDFVKIDRTLLGEEAEAAPALRRLKAMIGRLHEAGTRVAVEGIEDARQGLHAIEAGADLLQGFYLGSPAAGLEVAAGTGQLLEELLRLAGRGEPRGATARSPGDPGPSPGRGSSRSCSRA